MKARRKYERLQLEKMLKKWMRPEPEAFRAWRKNRALRVLEGKYYCKKGVGRDKMLNRAWKRMRYGRSEPT